MSRTTPNLVSTLKALNREAGVAPCRSDNGDGGAVLGNSQRFPGRRLRARRRPRSEGHKLGYIALTDAAPLVIAKEKGFFAKHGVPDMEILKQASWGATRDNMALGTKANGIDGGHILRPKTHLYATGKVMQNSQPLPMYTLLNLNEDCQAISVSNEFKDLKVGTDSSRAQRSLRQEEGSRQRRQGRHDLPRRHARSLDPLLARRRRHRSRQGRLAPSSCRHRKWSPT